ncbi:hypothetical protein [Helicobacter rodentium]|nr:hypothetical protein [Helicobacter rodentium]
MTKQKPKAMQDYRFASMGKILVDCALWDFKESLAMMIRFNES